VAVPARNLVQLGDADPVDAAPLAYAGLTPYHAIKLALPKLSGGGRYALVIGLGGLGQIGVQILKTLTGATVLATDTKPEAMRTAEAAGAVSIPSGPDQARDILDATGGRGFDAAFDFVGVGPTLNTAAAVMARQSRLTVVGIGGGTLEWSFFSNPSECEVTNTYWGTIEELHEVVAMYRQGQIVPEIERFSLADGPEAYGRLQAGEVTGRAVVVPHG
jgi:propanol-preferring alcohol dehydrogenase